MSRHKNLKSLIQDEYGYDDDYYYDDYDGYDDYSSSSRRSKPKPAAPKAKSAAPKAAAKAPQPKGAAPKAVTVKGAPLPTSTTKVSFGFASSNGTSAAAAAAAPKAEAKDKSQQQQQEKKKEEEVKPTVPAAAAVPTPAAAKQAAPAKAAQQAQQQQPKPGSAAAAATVALGKKEKERKEALEAEAKKEKKPRLALVCVGHVDAGKSTLMGHLLYLHGEVSQKQMHKFEKESKEMGKHSFRFAWVFDEHEEERSRGITVDVGVGHFETEHRSITLLDAPGHRDFIPNMISGAAQADVAILVVPATTGEFEGGFQDDGQTKEHAILVRSLGVQQLIVAVNKLDAVDWDEKRYNEILAQVTPFLIKQASFHPSNIWPVPVSGLTGENIKSRSDPRLCAWYKGPTLVELIDKFQPPERFADKPLRMSISDVFRSQTGLMVCGKVETGVVFPKDEVLVMPLGDTIQVKSIESRGKPLTLARAGDHVELCIKEPPDASLLMAGQIVCDKNRPVPLVTRFRARVITLNYKIPIVAGTEVVLFTSTASEPAHVSKLYAILDKSTGAVTKKGPRALPKGCSAEIEITTERPICLELFSEFRELGRFSLRRGVETVAVGIVTKISSATNRPAAGVPLFSPTS